MVRNVQQGGGRQSFTAHTAVATALWRRGSRREPSHRFAVLTGRRGHPSLPSHSAEPKLLAAARSFPGAICRSTPHRPQRAGGRRRHSDRRRDPARRGCGCGGRRHACADTVAGESAARRVGGAAFEPLHQGGDRRVDRPCAAVKDIAEDLGVLIELAKVVIWERRVGPAANLRK
jgi:hypothetical protein